MEHKELWGADRARSTAALGVPLGRAASLLRRGSDLTIVTWSRGIGPPTPAQTLPPNSACSVELIDLRTLWPWDRDAVLRIGRDAPAACWWCTRRCRSPASAPRSRPAPPRPPAAASPAWAHRASRWATPQVLENESRLSAAQDRRAALTLLRPDRAEHCRTRARPHLRFRSRQPDRRQRHDAKPLHTAAAASSSVPPLRPACWPALGAPAVRAGPPLVFKWANNIPLTHPSNIRIKEAVDAIKRRQQRPRRHPDLPEQPARRRHRHAVAGALRARSTSFRCRG